MSKRSRESSPPISPEQNCDSYAKHSRFDHKASSKPAVICSEKPLCQSQPFSSYEEYEVHYAKMHTNRCTECRKNFPSEHFLHLHIQETHDPLSQIRFERGDKIFGCLVDECGRMCRTPFKRKRHLIDKHSFPKDYNFFVTKDGIDKSISLLNDSQAKLRCRYDYKNCRQGILSSPSSSTTMDEISADTAVDTLSGSDDTTVTEVSRLMMSMKFVPPSVRFGRRGP